MHLLLTLGHNSSAITINNEGRIVGYEQERLNRIKSSSAFPLDALDLAIRNNPDTEEIDKAVFISHWFDNYDFHKREDLGRIEKYYDADTIGLLQSKGYKIVTLSRNLTHHDAHAWSAVSFFENHATFLDRAFKAHVIVCDGFGNRQEVISVYEVEWNNGEATLKKIHATLGYDRSLGLMYQFATAFCGMKENQDEYKFLGYESHIGTANVDVDALNSLIESAVDLEWSHYMDAGEPKVNLDYINVVALQEARERWHQQFDRVVFATGVPRNDEFKLRSVIGYYIQGVLEQFYKKLIGFYNISHLLLAGGVHYNVKLNNFIAKRVELISIVPLAGDQGCALGLYRAHGHKPRFKDLTWGVRNLKMDKTQLPVNVRYFEDETEYVDFVVNSVEQNLIVNTLTGAMEFGPRALCNTSTLALPYHSNVGFINDINGRNEVMPFAGVMMADNVPYFHAASDAQKVIGSLHYMITTLDYQPTVPSGMYRGIMHAHPTTPDLFTGRPQVVSKDSKSTIYKVLERLKTGAVINTSLNVHGVPICYSTTHALADLQYNLKKSWELGMSRSAPTLVIGNF